MRPSVLPYDVAILGAGAAGLFCARIAARRGLKAALLDRQSKPGRKLALAGGGMGNITNLDLDSRHYIGTDPDFCRPFLKKFGTRQALELLEESGIAWEERDLGQIFGLRPASELARTWADQCRERGADLFLEEEILDVRPPSENASGFFLVKTKRRVLHASQLVLATGSPAFPQCGASDFGARLARKTGHAVIPYRPVLVPLRMPPEWELHGLEGISLPAAVTVRPAGGGPEKRDPCGARPLLFTHQGISGPAALAASCFWHKGDALVIDFLPGQSVTDPLHAPENGKLLVKNLLARRLPSRLSEKLLPDDLAGSKCAEISKKDRQRLARRLHDYTIVPTDNAGMKRAEAAAGGVATKNIDSTMQSRLVPGLFFCGEVVDVTGLLGGYNIHWALASAFAAGNALKNRRGALFADSPGKMRVRMKGHSCAKCPPTPELPPFFP